MHSHSEPSLFLKQYLKKAFDDGTELSLYREGWVTLSGLPLGDSPPTIEHRQQAIDRIVAELWTELSGDARAAEESLSAATPPTCEGEGENFILDRSRGASKDRIRQFIPGSEPNAQTASSNHRNLGAETWMESWQHSGQLNVCQSHRRRSAVAAALPRLDFTGRRRYRDHSSAERTSSTGASVAPRNRSPTA